MKVFLDTNVLIYRIDFRVPGKRDAAANLVDAALAGGTAVLSTQVLQEFYSAATRKLGMPAGDAQAIAAEYARAEVVQIGRPLIFAAMDRHAAGGFSFWDALIVEAAMAGGAAVLYSEDMQDGQVVEGLAIRNPFC